MLSPLYCSALHLPVRCASLENNKWQQQTYIQLLDEHRQVLLPQILWRLFLQVIQLSSLHTNTHIHSVNQHVIVYIFLHVRTTDENEMNMMSVCKDIYRIPFGPSA